MVVVTTTMVEFKSDNDEDDDIDGGKMLTKNFVRIKKSN